MRLKSLSVRNTRAKQIISQCCIDRCTTYDRVRRL